MPASTSSGLKILGHRGATLEGASFFQNSFRAFEEAVTTSDGFETDACVDKDGEVFLIHEAKYVDPAKGVEYCAGEYMNGVSAERLGNRRIDQLTTAEMVQLRLKDGSPIPTLKQAIELVGAHKKILNIELKAFNVAGPVLRIVRDYLEKGVITPQSLIISSFNHPALQVVRREMPDISIGALFNYPDVAAAPIFPWWPDSDGAYIPLRPERLEDRVLKELELDYIIMPQELLTKDTFCMVEEAQPQARCAGWVFTERGAFDLPEFLSRLKRLEPTGKLAAIIVDNPRVFVKAARG